MTYLIPCNRNTSLYRDRHGIKCATYVNILNHSIIWTDNLNNEIKIYSNMKEFTNMHNKSMNGQILKHTHSFFMILWGVVSIIKERHFCSLYAYFRFWAYLGSAAPNIHFFPFFWVDIYIMFINRRKRSYTL